MAKTTRVDPMTGKRGRPGRAYWQHKRMSPKGDVVLSDGRVVDVNCDMPWGIKSRRETKTLTRRTARRILNREAKDTDE